MDPPVINEGGSDKAKKDEIPPGAYVERQVFCYCMPFKCMVIFIGIALIFDCFWETVQLIFIVINPHFESIYALLFGLILIPILVSAVFFIVWFCKDSKGTRALLPIGLIMAAIASFLLFLWIMVYILSIYPEKAVYISDYEKGHSSYSSE